MRIFTIFLADLLIVAGLGILGRAAFSLHEIVGMVYVGAVCLRFGLSISHVSRDKNGGKNE